MQVSIFCFIWKNQMSSLEINIFYTFIIYHCLFIGAPSNDEVNSATDVQNYVSATTPAQEALKIYQEQVIDEEISPQRITLSRLDGISDIRKDIMGYYKQSQLKLKAHLKVRFEEEDWEWACAGISRDGYRNSGGRYSLYW